MQESTMSIRSTYLCLKSQPHRVNSAETSSGSLTTHRRGSLQVAPHWSCLSCCTFQPELCSGVTGHYTIALQHFSLILIFLSRKKQLPSKEVSFQAPAATAPSPSSVAWPSFTAAMIVCSISASSCLRTPYDRLCWTFACSASTLPPSFSTRTHPCDSKLVSVGSCFSWTLMPAATSPSTSSRTRDVLWFHRPQFM